MLDLDIKFSLFLGGRKGKEWREKQKAEQAEKDKVAVIAELNKPKVKLDT